MRNGLGELCVLDDLERIQIALKQVYPEHDPVFERIDQLIDLDASFNLHSGEEKAIWQSRTKAVLATCGNCTFKWFAGFMPMQKEQLNRVIERAGFCVRCCESERVYFREVGTRKPLDFVPSSKQTPLPKFRHAQ